MFAPNLPEINSAPFKFQIFKVHFQISIYVKRNLPNYLKMIGLGGKEVKLLTPRLQIKLIFGSKTFVKQLWVFTIFADRKIFNYDVLNFQVNHV